MRSALYAALLLFTACRCEPPTSTVDERPLLVAPAALDFSGVYVGTAKSLTLDVSNPNLVAVDVTPSAPAPFSAAAFTLAAGTDQPVRVTFAPVAPGDFAGVVMVGDAGVTVTGTGVTPPPCTPSDACRAAAFDLDAGTCVETLLPDGTDCTASRACFLHAQCEGGTCIGTVTTCDDGDPCTTDVCGATGCGHVDGLLLCPGSTNPCLAPTCDRDAGCGFVAVSDGASCGVRDCQTAQVCINAACVSRAAPQTQDCTEVIAGNPEGDGYYDGFGRSARFGGAMHVAADSAGNVWVTDSARLRKVSPAGEVTYVAGREGLPFFMPPTDGFGGNAVLPGGLDLVVDAAGEIVFYDSGLWRQSTPAGLVVTWLGTFPSQSKPIADGIGPAAVMGSDVGVTLGAGGEIFTLEEDQLSQRVELRRISPFGEITTVATIATVPDVDHNFFDLAWTQGAVFIASEATGVSRWVGTDSTPFWTGTGAKRIAASPAGDIAIALDAQLLVLGPDGGTEATWSATTDLIDDVAYDAPGKWVLALSGAGARIVIFDGLSATLLAGPEWRFPLADGPLATAGLLQPGGIVIRPSGDIFIYDDLGVRQIANGAVSTWSSQPYHTNRDLAVLPSGDLVATIPFGLFRVTGPDAGSLFASASCTGLDSRGATVAASCMDGIHTWLAEDDGGVLDAGFLPHVNAGADLAFDDTGGFFTVNGFTMSEISSDGGTSVFTSLPLLYPTGGSITRAPNGDLFVIDAFNDAVLRVAPDGGVTTVVQLADLPSYVAIEDGGTLLVTVPDAVLRVRP